MKKILKKMLAIACAAITAIGVSSCAFGEESGKSAYEIAVENGFEGTEADWLAQITKGKSAYELAVENGFKGTEQEWLASLRGSDGKDAPQTDVYDAYKAAVDNGEFTGSFTEFLQEIFKQDVSANNDTEQIAHNVMSVVSLCCGFKGKNSMGDNGLEIGAPKASAGSGVVIDLDKKNGNALIVTNYHVVYESESGEENGISSSIWVYPYGSVVTYDKKTLKDENNGAQARFVGGAMDYDLALVEINGSELIKNSNLEVATFGNSDECTIGENVFVIGNAEAEGISVTSGVVAAETEYIEMKAVDNSGRQVLYRVLRTSSAVNHGNSGGGIFDASGKLIGIVNAKNVEEDVENMGYALPVNNVICVIRNILDNVENGVGKVKRALIGVTVQTVESYAYWNENGKLIIKEKCIVSEEVKEDAAAYGSIFKNDEFVALSLKRGGETVGSIEISRRHQVLDLLLLARLGDTVAVTVMRDGEQVQVEFTLDKEAYFKIYS